MGGRFRTLLLVDMAAFMEHADEALLPAVYDAVGKAFGVTPSALGMLTFIRALVQSLASPLAAYLALTYNRITIIAVGALGWGIATAAVGACTTYWQAAIAKGFNGIGLAIVLPTLQSLVADFHKDGSRGVAFGWYYGASRFGTVIGGMFATLMAGRMIGILAGWRFAFVFVAFLSLLLAAAVYMFAQDVQPESDFCLTSEQPLLKKDSKSAPPPLPKGRQLKELWKGIHKVLKVPTVQVIVLQGVAGSLPWSAMSFFTLWLELLGFDHEQAALLVGLLSVGQMMGAVLGGWMGDMAARVSPNAGRILCGQFSPLIAIPISGILLLGLPQDTSYAWAYGVFFFLIGLLGTWNAPSTNMPIFAEIIPPHLHTTVYAIDLAVEKSLSAAGAPLVGILAEHIFGYNTASGTSGKDLDNARAIAMGLLLLIAIPFLVCFSLHNLLYFTYPGDRDRAKRVIH